MVPSNLKERRHHGSFDAKECGRHPSSRGQVPEDKERDRSVMDHQRQIHQAEAAKLVRLRALRLAKEAADREAQARAATEAVAEPKRKGIRRVKPKAAMSEV
jgi:hypothetical protein